MTSPLEAAKYLADQVGIDLDVARNGKPQTSESDDGEPAVNPSPVLRLTDLWNARRMIETTAGRTLWCDVYNAWFIYDDRRFRRDETREIDRIAIRTVQGFYQRVAEMDSANDREKLAKWVIRSEAHRSRSVMVDSARALAPVHPSDFDREPMLFNVRNGTVDLETQLLRPHELGDRITKLANYEFIADAGCHHWHQFLGTIFDGNDDLISYWQRIFGYCLTGLLSEHALFILYGIGRNGKSTLLHILRRLAGDYGTHILARSLTTGKSDPQNFMLADLAGVRVATATEPGSGHRLDESLVKAMTGGDPIRAAHKHGRPFVFEPVFKPFLATNSKPEIRGTDEGIWSRPRLIPFDIVIPEDQRLPDHLLRGQLESELPGILNWALVGLQDFLDGGLADPEIVRASTREYREEMDELGEWIAASCVLHPVAEDLFSALYADYRRFTATEAGDALSNNAFSRSLTDRGIKSIKGSGNTTHKVGIARNGSSGAARVTEIPVGVTDNSGISRISPYTPSQGSYTETPVKTVTGNSSDMADEELFNDMLDAIEEAAQADAIRG